MPVIVTGAVIANLQGLAIPQTPPPKAMNWDPLLGVAVNVTVVPAGYCTQLLPQDWPEGTAVTCPLPFPI
jgi:hypothetical protein